MRNLSSIFYLNCYLILAYRTGKSLELKRISVLEVSAVAGGEAALPCDVKHPRGDAVFLILWFNDNLTTPIYSYDVRPDISETVSHWKDSSVFSGNRARLLVTERMAKLHINPVEERDQRFYKCRVDFQQHPTRTTRINLKVIVPPKSLSITQRGKGVTSVIGPFQEGDSTVLTCIAHGGQPSPNVYWYFGDKIVDDEEEEVRRKRATMESIDELDEKLLTLTNGKFKASPPKNAKSQMKLRRKVQNSVTLGPFTRNDLRKLVTCEASNSNKTAALSEAVMVDMNLPPLSIEIVGPRQAVSAGKEYRLVCEVIGSRPPPAIAWLKGTSRIMGETEETSTDGNMTRSTLIFVPKPPDDGTTITCRAKNPATQSAIEKSLAVTVYYVPEAVVKLASFLNPLNIKEGDDVYFECKITANPKSYKITWFHNGRELFHNQTSGILRSNQSLVIQRVQRGNGGKYSCTSSNIEGDGIAEPVTLDIKYAPLCAPLQMTTYGVAKKEDAEVSCKVNANPPSTKFKWTFNNTADTIDVPPGRYSTSPQLSTITYTPVTELDFGTLLCWAENAIGGQITPCVFHIVPAGRPDPPINCSVHNRTIVSFDVWCQPGFDGGLQQIFFLRVSQPSQKGFNFTSGKPTFKVAGLLAGNSYRLQIWAGNDKGYSVPVHLNAFTLNLLYRNPSHGPSEAEVRDGKKTGNESSLLGSLNVNSQGTSIPEQAKMWLWEMSSLIPMIAFAVTIGVLIVIVTALLIRQRMIQSDYSSAEKEDYSSTGPCFPNSSSILLNSKHADAVLDCDKREFQIEPEDTIGRQHFIAGGNIDITGSLLHSQSSYAIDIVKKNCLKHYQDMNNKQQQPTRTGVTFKENPVSCHASQGNLSQRHIDHIQRSFPVKQGSDFMTMNIQTGSLTPPLMGSNFHKDVPTVYATLGNRGSRIQANILRTSLSQASLEASLSRNAQDKPDGHGLGGSQHQQNSEFLARGTEDQEWNQSQDRCRLILKQDIYKHGVDNKRESSV